jgi:hypothetical protein
MSELIVIDDFYNNPNEVRDYALSKDFSVAGNYPGLRTDVELSEWFYGFKAVFEKILNRKITRWPEEYNSAYQYTIEGSKTWIHHDATQWACVVYLTPDAPLEAGTAIYKHKETGIFRDTPEATMDFNTEYNQEKDWDKIIEVGNMFNRAVIYSGNYYHCSAVAGFGNCKYTGRLFQTFFFDTE